MNLLIELLRLATAALEAFGSVLDLGTALVWLVIAVLVVLALKEKKN